MFVSSSTLLLLVLITNVSTTTRSNTRMTVQGFQTILTPPKVVVPRSCSRSATKVLFHSSSGKKDGAAARESSRCQTQRCENKMRNAAFVDGPRRGSMSRHSTMTTTNHNHNTMRLVQGVRDIVDDYDVFLLDMWGVLHDGTRPYTGVLHTIQQLKRYHQNKRLIVLSNSSKRRDQSVQMLTKLGFNVSDFDSIITSGEVSHQLLSNVAVNGSDAMMIKGGGGGAYQWASQCPIPDPKNVFVLGSGDDDVSYCETSGWTVVDDINKASLVVARGTFTVGTASGGSTHNTNNNHKRTDPDAYQTALSTCLHRAATRALPMLVTNPDKVRPDRDRSPMPGQIGDNYERMLETVAGVAAASSSGDINGTKSLVKRIGKPFADVYELALRQAGVTADRLRVCMVGDALETDVVGGSAFGIDTVWVVCDGIHSHEISSIIAKFENDIDDNEDDDDDDDSTADNLWKSATRVLHNFNEESTTTSYAAGRTLSPTILMPHFRW